MLCIPSTSTWAVTTDRYRRILLEDTDRLVRDDLLQKVGVPADGSKVITLGWGRTEGFKLSNELSKGVSKIVTWVEAIDATKKINDCTNDTVQNCIGSIQGRNQTS